MLEKLKLLFLSSFILIPLFTNSITLASESEEMPLSLQIDTLNSLIDVFEKECVVSGELKSEVEWCVVEKRRLDQDYERLQKIADSQSVTPSANPNCSDSQYNELSALIDQAVKANLSEQINCNNKTKILSSKCLEEVSCDLAHSVNHYYNPASVTSPLRACHQSDYFKTSCLQEIQRRGFLINMQHGYEAVFHFIPQLVKGAATKSWELIKNIDNVSSENLMIATKLSDIDLVEKAKNAAVFTKDFILSFISLVGDGIKSSYGCEAWSSLPYYSECLRPMTSWDCATCSQRLKAICGVIGYIGIGEATTAYLTGGAVGITKAIYKSATRFATMNGTLKSSINIDVLPEALNHAKRGETITLHSSVNSVSKLSKIRSKLHIISALKTSKDIVLSSLKVTTYPFNQYFRFLDVATNMGYRHGENVVYAANNFGTNITLALTLSSNPINKATPILTDSKTLEIIRHQKEIEIGTFKIDLNDNQVLIRSSK